MILVLPLPPNLANSRMNWARKHRERSAYFVRCDVLRLTKQIPRVPAVPMPCARISVVLTMPNAMDTDNSVSRCKYPIDWLVANKYLQGDTRRELVWAGMPEQVVSRRAVPSLTITLEPIALAVAA